MPKIGRNFGSLAEGALSISRVGHLSGIVSCATLRISGQSASALIVSALSGSALMVSALRVSALAVSIVRVSKRLPQSFTAELLARVSLFKFKTPAFAHASLALVLNLHGP